MYKRYISVHKLDRYDLEGDIDYVINRLQDLKKEYGPDIRLESEIEEDYYDDKRFVYLIQRPENAEETAERQAKEEENQKRLREHRRAEFERLKKEFGDE